MTAAPFALRPREIAPKMSAARFLSEKRRVGNQLGSSAAVKEASQTQLCAYLSVALLVGLVLNAAAGLWWADPLAALFIAGVAVKEGRESWRGEGCADGCC